jgi:hypothetical protein
LRAALLNSGVPLWRIEALLQDLRNARRQAVRLPLTPSSIQEIFPEIGTLGPSRMADAISPTWALLPEEIVRDDHATRDAARGLIREIRSLDQNYEPPELETLGDLPATREAMSAYINTLLFDRAIAISVVRGEHGPLQVETLRHLQIEVDRAYEAGALELENRRLTIRLSNNEALGNYIDGQVRRRARIRFSNSRIDWATSAIVRIQRREYDTSGTDATYRIPDVAVADIMFDATIQIKLPGRVQVRGYFFSDARPRGVIIVRPTALGGSYFITPPDGLLRSEFD